MKEFINEFMKTPYFFKYVVTEEDLDSVMGIYVAGSTSLGIEDEYSDYDIVILTAKPLVNKKFFEEYVRLKYKGRPMHWYYDDISYLFDLQDADNTNILGKVHFSKWFRITTIYENPKYLDLLAKLDSIKNSISICASYAFLNAQRPLLNKLTSQNNILKEDYNKFIYQCCFASCYLTNTQLDIDCLREIKRIYWNPVSQEYKDLAIQFLNGGINFIENNPIDYEKELQDLYDKIYE